MAVLGLRINNYEVVSLLGEGGMGAVYLARHPFIGRSAAIKVLRAEFVRDQSLVMRFMNEARAAHAIQHPNIIEIIDAGTLPDGRPYLMMEFLEGESLAARLGRETKILPDVVLEIACQTAGALEAAHEKGIVHRDLKPDNLFLVPDQELALGLRVKVLDFGIAKLAGNQLGNTPKTSTGAIMGTPLYMSPEQCRGLSDAIDRRSDIYSLGVILYHMLCGTPPFMSEGAGELLAMHMLTPPEPLRKRNGKLTSELEAVVMRALAKAPDARFQRMRDFQAALRQVDRFEGPEHTVDMLARAPTATLLAPKTTLSGASAVLAAASELPDEQVIPRRRKRALTVAAGALLAAGTVVAVLVGTGKPSRDRDAVKTGTRSAAPPPAAAVPAGGPAPTSPTPVLDPPTTARSDERPRPAPAMVQIRVKSMPSGANVIRTDDGTVLGVTPFEGSFARGNEHDTLRVSIEKRGYRSQPLVIPLAHDDALSVQLTVKNRTVRDPDAERKL